MIQTKLVHEPLQDLLRNSNIINIIDAEQPACIVQNPQRFGIVDTNNQTFSLVIPFEKSFEQANRWHRLTTKRIDDLLTGHVIDRQVIADTIECNTKDNTIQQLQALATRKQQVPRAQIEEMFRDSVLNNHENDDSTNYLQPQQHRIACYAAIGCTNKQIAQALALKTPTITNQLNKTYYRLGASDRVQSARWLREHGLTLPNHLTYRKEAAKYRQTITREIIVHELPESAHRIACYAQIGFRHEEMLLAAHIEKNTLKFHLYDLYQKTSTQNFNDMVTYMRIHGKNIKYHKEYLLDAAAFLYRHRVLNKNAGSS